MAKASVLDMLYTKKKSAIEFNFDMLTAPPLLSLLTPQDIFELNRIAKSVKLVGKIEEKYRLIDNIMNNRGFVKLHAGTNRVVYRFIEDQRFVIKVAIDRVGLGDNPAEFKNQFLLKPFVTKVFEVSPCGTVGLFERVDPIMSREEFASVADDIFNLLTKVFIGKYILEDVGCHYFLNWSVRKGFGPVLLDFPYVYELDGNKLYCNAPLVPGRKDIVCGGELDYDDGFNNLICTKCGKHYHARDLKKAEKEELIIVGGKKTMKLKVKIGKEVVVNTTKRKIAKVIDPEPEKETITVKKPREAIFNKTEDEKSTMVEDAIKTASAPEVDVKLNVDTTESPKDTLKEIADYVNDNLDKLLDEEDIEEIVNDTLDEVADYIDENSNEVSDEEDVENYNQYLSNRDREQIKKENKANKGNKNFEQF